jgi:hypothetical protein
VPGPEAVDTSAEFEPSHAPEYQPGATRVAG